MPLPELFDWFAADWTGTLDAINIESMAEVARIAIDLSKVLQGGTALQYSGLQGFFNGYDQAIETFLTDSTGGPDGIDASAK